VLYFSAISSEICRLVKGLFERIPGNRAGVAFGKQWVSPAERGLPARRCASTEPEKGHPGALRGGQRNAAPAQVFAAANIRQFGRDLLVF
jgi:hypothetical protein